jgi:hypothetical protein
MSRFVLAPEVEELLGPRGVEQLTSTEVFTCSCGQRSRTDDEPVSVYVEMDQAVDGPPMYRAALAHARCQPSRVLRRPGLVEQLLAAAAGGQPASAQAVFVIRTRRPRAVLIWSPYLQTMTAPAPGRSQVDMWLAAHVEAGFQPLGAALEEAELPVVEGWSLTVTAGELRLNDPLRGAACEQERDRDMEPWVAAAMADGRCLVLTGSRGKAAERPAWTLRRR